MTDEAIRDLERASRENPDDPRVMLQLVRALARAARGRQALERLDYDRVPREELPATVALAAELWREEVAGLERRRTFDVEGVRLLTVAEPLLAWAGTKGLVVTDLVSGAQTHRADGDHSEGGLVSASKRIFALDAGQKRLTCIEPSGVSVVAHKATRLLAASPRGDRLLSWDGRIASVHSWPGLDRLLERRVYGQPTIDWHSGYLIAPNSVGLYDLVPLAGGFPTLLEARDGEVLSLLGHGVVADRSTGVKLKALRGEWTLELFRAPSRTPPPSVARDGRGVRTLVGDTVVRFEVNLATGKLESSPELGPLASPARTEATQEPGLAWHPHADFVVRASGPEGFDLFGPRGCPRRHHEGAPVMWSREGFSLVVVRERPKQRIDVWSGRPL